MDVIEVSVEETARFALNVVSDGRTVTMTRGAPELAARLRERGMTVVERSGQARGRRAVSEYRRVVWVARWLSSLTSRSRNRPSGVRPVTVTPSMLSSRGLG